MSITFNSDTKKWDVVFDDLSTRSFDGRFTSSRVFEKAVRYQRGLDTWFDGEYNPDEP